VTVAIGSVSFEHAVDLGLGCGIVGNLCGRDRALMGGLSP